MTEENKVIKVDTKQYLKDNSSIKALVLVLYYYNNNKSSLNNYANELLRIVIAGINNDLVDAQDYGVNDLIRDIESILASDYELELEI